ncbi:MAG: FHA domain-containing protein [Chloroflexi bacterium]|nr:FHA domain-containing protein [Chloroflexota bacterium]
MSDHSSPSAFVIIAGPGAGKTIELPNKEIVIGRISPAELVISHVEVSRRHAQVAYRGGKYFIQDAGSKNGVRVNGEKISNERALADGDEIELAVGVKLKFQARAGIQPTSAPRPALADFALNQTMIEEDLHLSAMLKSAIPPTLLVTMAGGESASFTLTKDKMTIGRAEDNDIVINSMIVSRYHATLENTPRGYEVVVKSGATNTLSLQGHPVTDRHLLSDGDVLRIDSEFPGMMVSMAYQSPMQAAAKVPFTLRFGEKDKMTFGRDAGNDVALDTPNVSRYHAQITRVGRRYFITDLRSANGTFVNDQRVVGDVWLNPDDTIRVGPYKFVMGEDKFTRYDETEGLKVEAYHLNKWVRKDLNLLQDISLVYQPREFIVVVGQSGGGKSTLVDSIAGYRPASHGKVFVNGIDVYQNFDAIRNEIGYVPQKDIIHMELTVYQALDFAAQLRMPKDTTSAERKKRIMEVLADLDLTHRKDVQISGLSGGQQKRVSIGVELLTRPGLFFLDEPTSGLDPGTETMFMHLMRRLADQGRTIITVTHATKNVMLADKVVFLARGGFLAWFGPPNEALAYFDQFRSEHDRRVRAMEFDQIYTILDDASKGSPKDWAKRYQENEAYQKYIYEPLLSKEKKAAGPATPPKVEKKRKTARSSAWRQFVVLSKRNLTILRRDRSSLILMLVAAPAVAALDLILAPAMGRAPFSFQDGDAANGGVTLFLMTIYALLVGGMSQMREFVREADIYKRERLVNLQIVPYVTSKVWVALLLAFYHGLAYTAMHYLAFEMPGGFAEFIQIYITMAFATLTGMMLGLVASSLAPNAASAPLTMIMMIVPLIVLSGALAPIPPNISQVASTRWAFQGLLGIVGAGKDVAADACWQLDEDLRDAMTLDDKAYNQCLCMGVNVFNEAACSFPGVGKYYVSEIDEIAPTEPPAMPPEPPEPVIPDAPAPPDDNFDQVKMAQYLNTLSSYQDNVKDIQDGYKNQMNLYRSVGDVYEGEMKKYQEDLALYNISRVSAVKGAEGVIGSVTEQYGWAWVDKDDPNLYFPWLFNTWFAQVKISLVYFVLILYLIKRKDVK